MIDYRIGDCRELLKEIPDESVRLVVTSPPYNIGKPYGHYKDKIPLDKWQELISDVTREVYRILTPDGGFFLNLYIQFIFCFEKINYYILQQSSKLNI